MHGRTLLTLLILTGLVSGAVFGEWFLFDRATGEGIEPDHWTKVAGDTVLMRPLKLMVIPIVLISVVVAVTSIRNPARLGVVGGSTILYYVVTMLVAVSIGTTLVATVRPGEIDQEMRTKLVQDAPRNFAQPDVATAIEPARQENLGHAFLHVLRRLIPENLVSEMASGGTLGVIVFALLLGLALAAGGEATAPAVRLFDAMFDAIMRLIRWIIWLAPVGLFFLVAWTVGRIGLDSVVWPLGKYIALVVAGLLIQSFIVLPGVLFLFTRRNPFRFMWQMRRALMTAFGTASSSATLPVTMESAQNEGGCSRRSASFVLPLGSTINMDGTALYVAAAVVFLFQLYGIELQFEQLLVVVISATLAVIGAPGIPSAGLIMMVIVINTVNLSLGGTAKELSLEAIGVIIAVDRIADMCRTTVNVWGDAVGAKLITKLAPDEPEPGMARTAA